MARGVTEADLLDYRRRIFARYAAVRETARTEPERAPLATWMSSESDRPGVPSGAPSGADG